MYKKFEQLLNERGLKANDVAKGTGLYRSVFSDWKSGRAVPKIDKIQKIADFFNVPVSYFLDTASVEKEATSVGIDVDVEKQRIYALTKDEATMEILKGLESLTSEQKSAILAVIKSYNTK